MYRNAAKPLKFGSGLGYVLTTATVVNSTYQYHKGNISGKRLTFDLSLTLSLEVVAYVGGSAAALPAVGIATTSVMAYDQAEKSFGTGSRDDGLPGMNGLVWRNLNFNFISINVMNGFSDIPTKFGRKS